MSVLRFPEGMNSIWDNAAFDNGESDISSAILTPRALNPSDSLDSFSSKAIHSPLLEKSTICIAEKPPIPLKALNPDKAVEISRIKSIKTVPKPIFDEKSICNGWKDEVIRDEMQIDQEIEEIEREISGLSSRLEALRIEKFEKSVKVLEKRVTAESEKLTEQKKKLNILKEKKMIEEGMVISARSKMPRRGLSLCPGEIAAVKKRGLSLGPAEISKSRQFGMQERIATPVQATQNRRKSCFWKLQIIGEEDGVSKERGKSLSLSPKARKGVVKAQAARQVATTIASKKGVKKEDGFASSIQPKKLFEDWVKSVASSKKTPRPGKIVASRYNQSTPQTSALRKRSLTENDIDGSKRCDKKRSLSVGKSFVAPPEIKNFRTQIRPKKKWEIPSDLLVHRSSENENSPPDILMPDLLPKLMISRCINETPRDSGPAKKVIDLIGRKSFFSNDEQEKTSICQVLSFA